MPKTTKRKIKERVEKPSSTLGIVINKNFNDYTETGIRELIRRRRRQMLVHSCMYYRLGTSIWTDKKFDECARELAKLQRLYPNISKTVEYYEDFKDWDGTTGYHLQPMGDPDILAIASSLSKKQVKLRDRKILNLNLNFS